MRKILIRILDPKPLQLEESSITIINSKELKIIERAIKKILLSREL